MGPPGVGPEPGLGGWFGSSTGLEVWGPFCCVSVWPWDVGPVGDDGESGLFCCCCMAPRPPPSLQLATSININVHICIICLPEFNDINYTYLNVFMLE